MAMHFEKNTQEHEMPRLPWKPHVSPPYVQYFIFLQRPAFSLSYLTRSSESRMLNQTFPKNAIANKVSCANVQQSLQIILNQKCRG